MTNISFNLVHFKILNACVLANYGICNLFHRLAAAVQCKLNLIIPFNLKAFKTKDLSKWYIEAMHTQDYLLTIYSKKPGVVMMKLVKIAQKKEQDLEDTMLDFGVALPKFSKKLLEDMGEDTIY